MEASFRHIPGVEPFHPPPASTEDFFFLEEQGEYIYVAVHHPREAPLAQVFFCPPFGIERTFAYTSVVRMSRCLAHAGFQVVRFDFRSMGESSGRTEDLGISDWLDDARFVFDRTRSQTKTTPRYLSGLRFGAFVAATLFSAGSGDALLVLDPVHDIRSMLMRLLNRKLAESFVRGAAGSSGAKKTRCTYVTELETERVLEVEGYLWGKKLWDESELFAFPVPSESDPRPTLVIHLDKRSANRYHLPHPSETIPVSSPPFWTTGPLILSDLSQLISRMLGFLSAVTNQGSVPPPASAPSVIAPTSTVVPGSTRASTATCAAERRRAFTWEVGPHRFVGTVHLPRGEPLETALVLFNGGQIPRIAHGSVSAKIGAALAARGMHVYRVDLPGLGDSPGDLPPTLNELFRANEEGRQVPFVTDFLKHLELRLGHSHVIAGGLCGAAGNALYSAASDPSLFEGILMLEVQFFLVLPAAHEKTPAQSVFAKLLSRRSWIGVLTGESRYRFTHKLAMARRILLPLVTRKGLAQSVNLPLVIALARVCEAKIPVLSITCQNSLRETYLDYVEESLLSPRHRPSITDIHLSQTNHIFTTGRAIDRLIEEIQNWIRWKLDVPLHDLPHPE